MPFNGQLNNKINYEFYLNGVIADSNSFGSDVWDHLVHLIIPTDKDSFLIDSRNKISRELFNRSKIFFLKKGDRVETETSKIINVDTLQLETYSQIKIPDREFYIYYEKIKRCPIGNHKNHLVEYLWGLPNEEGCRLAKKKKVILMGCLGSGEGGQLYYCKVHQIDF